MMVYGGSFEVFIHACAAESGVALVLLHVGLGPSSKRLEVGEGGGVVVVGVPEGVCAGSSAGREAAHDSLPHKPRGVDAGGLPVTLDPGDQLIQVVAVAGVVAAPPAARTGIGLHVDPHHPVEIGGDALDHLVDLGVGGLAPAGEHVDVGGEACGAGVVEVGVDVGVDCAEGLIAAGDGEGEAVVLDAGVGGRGEQLTHVHAVCAECRQHQQQRHQYLLHHQSTIQLEILHRFKRYHLKSQLKEQQGSCCDHQVVVMIR